MGISPRAGGTRRLAVVGGGIGGLASAYYALRDHPDTEVVLLEASSRFGGLIRTIRHEGFVLDAGPDGFLTRKPAARELCRDLGIEDRLIPRNEGYRAAYVRRGGVLMRLPAAMRLFVPLDQEELLDAGILSPEGVRRVFREPEIPRSGESGNRGENPDESVAEFFTRRFGEEMYRYIAEPLAAGIFTGNGEKLSMEANFPELPRLERAHGAVLPELCRPREAAHNDDLFRSFPTGMETLVEELLRTLKTSDRCRLEPETSVQRLLRPAGKRWRIETGDGRSFTADAVVCALPADAAATVLRPIDGILADILAATVYSRSVTVFLAYNKIDVPSLPAGSGYLVPRAEGSPVLACTWCSQKWSGRAPEGTELFRVFLTGERWETAITTARREMSLTLGIEKEPLFTEVFTLPRAIPQYTLGHLQRRKQAELRLQAVPGLAIAGATLFGVGVPDCVRSGREAVRTVYAGTNQAG